MRVNGFESPFNELQILAWFLLPVVIAQFFVLIVPQLYFGVNIAIGSAFGICLVVVLSYGSHAMLINPIDPFLEAHINGTKSESANEDKSNRIFCYLCQVHVDKSSKHCRYCDKCVLKFDHHCKWLNNCVGHRNYRSFFIALCGISTMITLSLLFCLWFFVEYLISPSLISDRLMLNISPTVFFALIIISIVIILPIWAMAIQLLVFHVVLWKRGQTTLDFIVEKQKEMKLKEKERKDNKKMLDKDYLGSQEKQGASVSPTKRNGHKQQPAGTRSDSKENSHSLPGSAAGIKQEQEIESGSYSSHSSSSPPSPSSPAAAHHQQQRTPGNITPISTPVQTPPTTSDSKVIPSQSQEKLLGSRQELVAYDNNTATL